MNRCYIQSSLLHGCACILQYQCIIMGRRGDRERWTTSLLFSHCARVLLQYYSMPAPLYRFAGPIHTHDLLAISAWVSKWSTFHDWESQACVHKRWIFIPSHQMQIELVLAEKPLLDYSHMMKNESKPFVQVVVVQPIAFDAYRASLATTSGGRSFWRWHWYFLHSMASQADDK